jgi:cell division protein FtsN
VTASKSRRAVKAISFTVIGILVTLIVGLALLTIFD